MTTRVLLNKPYQVADQVRDNYITESGLTSDKTTAQDARELMVKALDTAYRQGQLDLTEVWYHVAANSWKRRLREGAAEVDAYLDTQQGTLFDISDDALLSLGKAEHSHLPDAKCDDICPYGKDESRVYGNFDADATLRHQQVLNENAGRAAERRDKNFQRFTEPLIRLFIQNPGKKLKELRP